LAAAAQIAEKLNSTSTVEGKNKKYMSVSGTKTAELTKAYNSSVVWIALRALGFDALTNIGFYSYFRPWTWLDAPAAQVRAAVASLPKPAAACCCWATCASEGLPEHELLLRNCEYARQNVH
jgi:hypothetical protein